MYAVESGGQQVGHMAWKVKNDAEKKFTGKTHETPGARCKKTEGKPRDLMYMDGWG